MWPAEGWPITRKKIIFILAINVHIQRLQVQSRFLLATTLIFPYHVCLLKAVYHPVFLRCSTFFVSIINLYEMYRNVCIKSQQFCPYSVHMLHVIAVTDKHARWQ